MHNRAPAESHDLNDNHISLADELSDSWC